MHVRKGVGTKSLHENQGRREKSCQCVLSIFTTIQIDSLYLLKYSILIKINEKQTIRNDFEHCHKQRNNNWE